MTWRTWGAVGGAAVSLVGAVASLVAVGFFGARQDDAAAQTLFLLANRTAWTWLHLAWAAFYVCVACLVVAVAVAVWRVVPPRGRRAALWVAPVVAVGLLVAGAGAAFLAWVGTYSTYVVAACPGLPEDERVALEERPSIAGPTWIVYTGGPHLFTRTATRFDGDQHESPLAFGDYSIACRPDGTGTFHVGDDVAVELPYRHD